ncbi:MAG: glyoxalase [Butyrivibrio sp.]|uniref:glyoxalase n=1 Tax=Butyrivibrio sp. TaxID=28121 RepID=UPI0025FF63E8|nr:glyoxalase [Butyrivibrio sp.]MCR5770708.1 glyoxalase [Butyrivibrio sp.]
MHEFDDDVLDYFIENQGQLFPEDVASSREEAEAFLEDCCAVVVGSVDEVIEYFDEAGVDFDADSIMDASEVFDIGDGRFLIVEG